MDRINRVIAQRRVVWGDDGFEMKMDESFFTRGDICMNMFLDVSCLGLGDLEHMANQTPRVDFATLREKFAEASLFFEKVDFFNRLGTFDMFNSEPTCSAILARVFGLDRIQQQLGRLLWHYTEIIRHLIDQGHLFGFLWMEMVGEFVYELIQSCWEKFKAHHRAVRTLYYVFEAFPEFLAGAHQSHAYMIWEQTHNVGKLVREKDLVFHFSTVDEFKRDLGFDVKEVVTRITHIKSLVYRRKEIVPISYERTWLPKSHENFIRMFQRKPSYAEQVGCAFYLAKENQLWVECFAKRKMLNYFIYGMRKKLPEDVIGVIAMELANL